MKKETRLSVPFDGFPARCDLTAFSAIHEEPASDRRDSAILLANGAGFHMESPFMAAVAKGLVARGFGVLRFNYAYRERALAEGKNRPPDRTPVLEDAHAAALRELESRADGRRLILAGKSLGARMSSHLAAKDVPCAGLVYLGYPLHAPGKKDRPRSDHFPAIVQPSLFLQGTRDTLCDLTLLDEALQKYGGRAEVEVIEGADHGFHVLKSIGKTDEEVLEGMLDRIDRWEREVWP